MKKIGIIELGTTSAKLILAYLLDNVDSYVVFDQMVEPLRIAEDMEKDAIIKNEKMEETLEVLKSFKALCDANEVKNVIAVTADSIKKAKNQKGFLDELYNETGFSFSVIKNDDQIKTTYNAVINSLDQPKGVVLDISGSRVNLIQYSRRNILNKAMIDMGALSMIERYIGMDDDKIEEANQKIVELFYEEFSKIKWLKKVGPEFKIVGVGANIQTAVKTVQRMNKYPLDFIHAFETETSAFVDLYEKIRKVDLTRAANIKGVDSNRADLLGSTVCIIKAFIDRLEHFDNINAENSQEDADSETPDPKRFFVSSKKGFAEGVLMEHAIPSISDKPVSSVIDLSLETIFEFSKVYDTNNDHVFDLVSIIYEEIRVLHKLPKEFKKVLKVASKMYDSGKKISYYNFQRNSFDVILNSELDGLNHRELLLAAFSASAQNLNNLKAADWVKYKDILNKGDLEAIKKIAIMIKLAASLDRFSKTRVIDLNCDILGASVIIKTVLDGKATLELRESRKVNSSFKEAFSKSLEIL